MSYSAKQFLTAGYAPAAALQRPAVTPGGPRKQAMEQTTLTTTPSGNTNSGSRSYLQRFVVKQDARIFFIPAEEVDWIQSAANYVRLHAGDRSYMVRETMQRLVSSLDPQRFLRVHRNAIINLASVREFEVSGQGKMSVTLRTGMKVPLSRSYQSTVRNLLRNSA
jgi:two-component system LytT family response regulator